MSMVELESVSGIGVMANTRVALDLGAMKTLIESGVSNADVARIFKVSQTIVAKHRKKEGWLSPAKVDSLRKEIEAKQSEHLRRSGKAIDVNEAKAQIWLERGEALREKTFNIARAALEGVTEEKAKKFIQNPLGLAHMTEVVRKITGEEAAEAAAAPTIAVNIGFLKGVKPVPVSQPIDV